MVRNDRSLTFGGRNDESKMSAPMNQRLPNKDTVNLLVRANIAFVPVVILLVYVPLNTHLPVDIIHDCLTSTKALILLFVLFHVGLNAFTVPKYAQNKSSAFKVRSLVKACGTLVLGCVSFHSVAVLFGAPFIESVAETFHLSMLLTTTTVLPSLCVLGINFPLWVKVYIQHSADVGAESILYCTSVGSVVGAWLGAIPIPLDWDRPWQVWPITCVLGTLTGCLLGLVVGVTHLYLQYHKSKKFKIT